MNWNKLTESAQLDTIIEQSKTLPVLIFKHSTTCSISAMALSRLERKWSETNSQDMTPYYLDLLNFRPISKEIADRFEIEHQSPQVLLIANGKCIYNASHYDIAMSEIENALTLV